MSLIKLSNIVWNETVQIIVKDRLKTTTMTKSNPVLILPPYHDKELCPIASLSRYIELTAVLRSDSDSLFVGLAKAHKPVNSQTISRWLVSVLRLAGIDSNLFGAHSYRHSSTSKAFKLGIQVDTILKRVGWTPNSQTFARFYNRPIDNSGDFASAILNTSN